MSVRVRDAAPADLDAVLALHRESFPASLTTRLGPAVLRHYYRQAFDRPAAMKLVVAEIDGTVAGFAAVLPSSDRFYRAYRRQRFVLLGLALPTLLRSPAVARQLIGAYGRAGATVREESPDAELSSIAVGAAFRRRGVGAALVDAAVRAMPRGAHWLYLWTDAERNDDTLAFYQRLGFVAGAERRFDGRRRMVRLSLRPHLVRGQNAS
jgi:ribosomal protein S18 acetylase RimI-like enzyme